MFAEFGPAPLCLELDFDSYDGPWQHVSRFRRSSGWLLVAKATVQSEHDILTAKLFAACDERENPVPAFQAQHLTECDWINPTFCDELPPDILDDLICEQEGELVRRWHREKNVGLAEAFQAQEQRIAELEGRVRAAVRRNERQAAELRQRRRHPDATPEMRATLAAVIGNLTGENDQLVTEMSVTRETIRLQAEAAEEALWSREDLLIEVEPLHLVRWSALQSSRYAPPPSSRARRSQYVPACGRTGLQVTDSSSVVLQAAASLKARAEAKKRAQAEVDLIARKVSANDRSPIRRELPKHSPALKIVRRGSTNLSVTPAPVGNEMDWTRERIQALCSMWSDGQSASTIAMALGNTSRNAVIAKAQRLGLPKSNLSAGAKRLQPILATTELRNLRLERERLQRSLAALAVRRRKFCEGSKKSKRSLEQCDEIEGKITAIDRTIQMAERRLEGHK